MPRVSTANLFDKDIRAMLPANKVYKKAVGNPKELYIKVYPSGMKTFFIQYKNTTHFKLKEFREGIYSVAEARRDAIEIIRKFESGFVRSKDKYRISELFDRYIDKKEKIDQLDKVYIDKIKSRIKKYILPKFGNVDIKDINFNDLKTILTPLFNPYNPKKSRLETIHRIINTLNSLYENAIKDRYIDYNPCKALHDEFPTSNSFSLRNGIDTRYPAITDENELKEFLTDLRNDSKLDPQVKRAVMLQILCVNRPINTVSAEWKDIDLKKGIWTIPPIQMKMRHAHQITLSKQALSVLLEQIQYTPLESNFVFPSLTKTVHINRDSISNAIRNIGGREKYNSKASAHGFRATFKTICSLHLTDLTQLGISDKTIENALALTESNAVKYAYERQTATIDQNRILMQWYADYLNNLVQFV